VGQQALVEANFALRVVGDLWRYWRRGDERERHALFERRAVPTRDPR
jgi:hypothetical protein